MKKSFITLTLSNFILILGILSLLLTVEHNFYYAGVLILLAAVYVHFEPTLLNKMKMSFEDQNASGSPALLLTFAITAVTLIYLVFEFKTFGLLSLLPCLLFPMAGLYQLRKTESSLHRLWTPILPLPYAGAALVFISLILQQSLSLRVIPYLLMIIFSYLMVRPKKS